MSDAITTKKCKCLEVNNGRIQLKCTHTYYYQVQLAMFCTTTQWCDFLLRTTVETTVREYSLSALQCSLPWGAFIYLPFFQNFLWRLSRSRSQKTGLPTKTASFRSWSILLVELSLKGMFTPWYTVINPNSLYKHTYTHMFVKLFIKYINENNLLLQSNTFAIFFHAVENEVNHAQKNTWEFFTCGLLFPELVGIP